MKKILGIFILAVLSVSCTQDLQENTPTLQATVDNALWRAGDVSASLDADGNLIITAYRGYETLVFQIADPEVGTYSLGTDSSDSYVTYTYNDAGNNIYMEYDTDVYPGPAYEIAYIVNDGTNYIAGNILQTTFSTNTPDSGSGLRVKVESVNSEAGITDLSIVSRGDGYYAGDQVIVVGGDNNAIIEVLNTQTSNGEITIESIENGKFTGSFKFSATDGEGSISFSDGFFYKVPIR